MNTTLRTASLLLPMSHVFFASVAFSAEPASPPATQPAPAPAPAPAMNSMSAPAVAAPSSTANSPAPAMPPTVVAQPDATPPASSLAPSPYGAPNTPPPPGETKSSPNPPAGPEDDGPPTLLSKTGDYAFGGFGGIGVDYTRFAGENAVQVCGEGAVIIDHALTLGGGGCGITTMVNAEKYGPEPHNPNDRLTFGYGGAIIRYHLFSHSLVNLGVGALIGAGGLSIGTLNDGSENTKYTNVRSEAVFVFEPQVGAYANVTRWLRVGITGGWRLASSVKMQGLSAADLSSPVLGGVIQGGWF